MTNDYRNLTDAAIEAHDASLRVQMKGLVAERAKRREEREQEQDPVTAEQHDWNLWTLGRVINSLRMMPDNGLSSLTVVWSTTGSMIDAELARRAEAKRMTMSSQQWADHLVRTGEANVRSAFANMLKEHNPGLDDPAADRLLKDIAEQPEEPEEPRFEICVRMQGGKDWLPPAATDFRAQDGSLRLFSSSGGEVALIAPSEWTVAWKRAAQ